MPEMMLVSVFVSGQTLILKTGETISISSEAGYTETKSDITMACSRPRGQHTNSLELWKMKFTPMKHELAGGEVNLLPSVASCLQRKDI